MAKPGDTGFTSSTGPTKVEPKTTVDYEVNEKGEAYNRTDLAALSIGVRCCSVVCVEELQALSVSLVTPFGTRSTRHTSSVQPLLAGHRVLRNLCLQPA